MLTPKPVQNRILAHLPDATLTALRPHLKVRHVEQYAVLQEQQRKIHSIYFIESGMANLFTFSDHRRVEIGIVGRYGFVGVPIVLGRTCAAHQCVMEVEGDAVEVNAREVRRWMRRYPGVRLQLMKFVQALLVQNSQMSLCNIIHPLNERLATWLLLSHDRLDGDMIPLNYELLPMVLNVQWPAVEAALAALETAGIVKKRQGHIEITNRSLLEQTACKCYRIIVGEYRRLLAPRSRSVIGQVHGL